MAQRSAVVDYPADNVFRVRWTGLLNGDNGEPVMLPSAPDKCAHVTGTQGVGGNLKVKGTNGTVIDTANDPVLTDPQGTAGGVFAAGVNLIEQIEENPLLVYPHVTAGDGSTNLACTIICKR